MADENPNARNLDLNLGPVDNSSYDSSPGSGSYPHVPMNLEDWLDGPVHRVSDVVRRRSRRWRSPLSQVPIPPETMNLALELNGGIEQQTGEGSVAAEERPMAKMPENGIGSLEVGDMSKKEDCVGNDGDEVSFFDCNICLDLAKDPVVTCCGHLFCWPCLYPWLHHHSDAKECPVCKGEVMVKNLTPIYGRGSSILETIVDSSMKIPLRPRARRVESWRQASQRTAFAIPTEEMIRRLGSTHPAATALLNLTSVINSAERLVESYFQDHPVDMNQELPPPADDRDSLSSIAAVIHSDSQTIDNAIEIDSTVSRSTLSSRRRNNASRISDVGTGDSPVPRRRRRLN